MFENNEKIKLPDLDFLSTLNSQQKNAVLNTEGPLLVLSGAGTGKTKVLTTRLANIIYTRKGSIKDILCVTFTNKAAFEMKMRVEKILIDELQKAHPDYGIVTEESGVINGNNKIQRWIIDPIDGTLNFLNGVPQFAISVAYEENNEILCGVILNPVTNEMYCAEKGNGAYLNNSRIRVSKKKKVKDSLLVTGGPKQTSKIKKQIFSEYIEISNKSSSVRKFGSAALDMAFVACGRFDGYWQREINVWDVAAGVVIVKEAGGFIDYFEDDTQFPLKKNILATNSSIHDELKVLISKKVIE